MVLRFTYPILLFCIVLLTYAPGDAVKDLEEKYSWIYFHKNVNDQFEETKSPDQPSSKIIKDHNMEQHHGHNHVESAEYAPGDAVKDLEEKYSWIYFHKNVNDQFEETKSPDQPSSKIKKDHNMEQHHGHNHVESAEYAPGDAVKDLEEKYSWIYFHKNVNDQFEETKSPDQPSSKIKKDHNMEQHHGHNHVESAEYAPGDAVKDLEEKSSWIYFHKNVNEQFEETKSPDQPSSKIMKDHNMEQHHGHNHAENAEYAPGDAVKDLEEKYSWIYFHKNVNDQFEETKSPGQPSSKIMKDHNMEQHHGHNHAESAEIGLFTIDELRGFYVGKKLPLFFPIKDHSLYPPFLPKEVADTIPFSSSQAPTILQLFSVSPDFPKGKVVRETLRKCELEAAQGETKICATSLESLLGFLRKAFEPEVDFKFITTSHPTITTPTLQNYTVLEPPREIQSAKKVACHPLPYLYAIYFCHFDASETKAFKLSLVGDSGDKVDAVVVCHMDTSGWSSDHISFRMLGIKQGNSICHVFAEGNMVWIQPSPIAAM
ncbi:BURP domain-containing protein 11-like isoform X2 [Durio zibethinus]|uniref:BURP domain-containing protein 11-like isoform X2 n=1 Tax=Durio zibethinus TaxID=66656 RepID=A0A6P5Z8N5_DURZI|nr:BURP domain-containing protein 11-like isoform X2 [Durio zibethinus]